ncbi:helix-turn-helix domain-containing protein [Mesorhizobium loti]|nr:hypothetical protein A9174_33050 [Mesorhizobium loti NZP2037]OBP78550.1 hypothetical protein BAE41_30405 [Mesorhizobium loti]QKC66597.1 helix-turn-helix domain-containing protein [Mesorhizobium jarvisii]OBP97346.1 hypothetical protein BAE38_00100 [Mesorhizobium loti]OBQ69996.1 hypothetical protein A9K72_33790 [Mesorhizobium loti]
MHPHGMSLNGSASDRRRLQVIVADPGSLEGVMSGDGLGTSAIMAETDKSKTCVCRSQERFMRECFDGLLRDRSRSPGRAPVPPKHVAEIVRLTQATPPHEAAHWTLRAMSTVAGIEASTVQGI